MATESDIELFVVALKTALRAHPELRIGQLLDNASTDDLFYVADDELASDLFRMANEA